MGAEVEDPREAHSIAIAVLDSLARFDVPATWSGYVEDRIEVGPLEWRRRRWTDSPRVVGAAVKSNREAFPEFRPKRQLELFGSAISEGALERYKRIVRAYHSCDAFDATLSLVMRGAWATLGGQRGQVAHFGDPHTFVRSGDTTVMFPRDALTNLAARDAAELRARAMRVRRTLGPESHPPKSAWWKFWQRRTS